MQTGIRLGLAIVGTLLLSSCGIDVSVEEKSSQESTPTTNGYFGVVRGCPTAALEVEEKIVYDVKCSPVFHGADHAAVQNQLREWHKANCQKEMPVGNARRYQGCTIRSNQTSFTIVSPRSKLDGPMNEPGNCSGQAPDVFGSLKCD